MYSRTLLRKTPNRIVNFPYNPNHNFFIWASPNLLVHMYDRGLKSWPVKYSAEEHMDEYLDQYGTNEHEDFTLIDLRIDDLPLSTSLAEPGFDNNLVPEPDIDSACRLSLSC